MFDKLDFITEKYDELAKKVSDPEVINNQPVWQKHVKEMGEMEPIVNKYKEYKKAKSDLAEAKEMLEEGDDEMKELAKMEIGDLEDKITDLEEELKILLIPKTRMMIRMLSWRSEQAREGKKQPSSELTFSGCTPDTPREGTGKRR